MEHEVGILHRARIAAYRDALSSYQKLADAHPGVTEIRVRLALSHFQFGVQLSWWGKLTEADYHVTGEELLRGACELAVEEFGMMAPVVFRQWGVRATDDVGNLVAVLLNKSM